MQGSEEGGVFVPVNTDRGTRFITDGKNQVRHSKGEEKQNQYWTLCFCLVSGGMMEAWANSTEQQNRPGGRAVGLQLRAVITHQHTYGVLFTSSLFVCLAAAIFFLICSMCIRTTRCHCDREKHAFKSTLSLFHSVNHQLNCCISSYMHHPLQLKYKYITPSSKYKCNRCKNLGFYFLLLP